MYVAFWGNGVAYSKKGFPLSPSTQTCWHFWAFLRAGTQRRSYYWPMAISIKKTSIQRLHRATEGGGGGCLLRGCGGPAQLQEGSGVYQSWRQGEGFPYNRWVHFMLACNTGKRDSLTRLLMSAFKGTVSREFFAPVFFHQTSDIRLNMALFDCDIPIWRTNPYISGTDIGDILSLILWTPNECTLLKISHSLHGM